MALSTGRTGRAKDLAMLPRAAASVLQPQPVLWLASKLPTARPQYEYFKIRHDVGPILELSMQAICNFVEALHSSGGLLQPKPDTGLNLPLCFLQNYTKLPGKRSPILFISLPLPAMKLQRKPVGAFCCLVAVMCNFWKCWSRMKRPGRTTPAAPCDGPCLS